MSEPLSPKEHQNVNIVDWIAAHEQGAEWPPFCEHCGKVLEAYYETLPSGMRQWHNEVYKYECPCCARRGIVTPHPYCLKCFQEIKDEIHDALATFLVYDPDTGKKVK